MFPKTTSVLKDRTLLETKLCDTLKIHIIIGQVFGACPINITLREKSQKSKSVFLIKLTKWAHIYWSAFVLAAIITFMVHKFREYQLQMSFIDKFLCLMEYGFNIVNCFIVMIGCNYQRHCYAKYLAALVEIDTKLLHLGVSPHFSGLKKFLRILSWILLALLASLFLIILFYHKFVILDALEVNCIYLLPNIIVFLALFEYFGLLYALSERFNQITCIIRRLSAGNVLEINQIKRGAVAGIFIKPQTWSYLKNNNFLDNTMSIEGVLNVLRRIYYELNVLESATSSSFGIMVVSLITSAFIVVCTQLYQIYIVYSKTIIGFNIYAELYSLFWLFLHSAKVLAIFFLNSKVSNEVINLYLIFCLFSMTKKYILNLFYLF